MSKDVTLVVGKVEGTITIECGAVGGGGGNGTRLIMDEKESKKELSERLRLQHDERALVEDGWTPVVDGNCPSPQIFKAKAGEWEWRLKNGDTYNPHVAAIGMHWGKCLNPDIVAVRLVKQSSTLKERLEDGWIPHDGGPCPIPWAKAGEWEFRMRTRTSHLCTGSSERFRWGHRKDAGDIIAYRLTNGWVPVVGGKCPQSLGWKSHEWEWRGSEGNVETGYCDLEVDNWSIAVAVRRIKQPDELVCNGANCGCTDGRSHSKECVAEHEQTTGMFSEDQLKRLARAHPETRDHKEPGVIRAAKSTKSTLGEQIEHAKAQYDSWPPEKKKSVQLQGQDIFLERMASFEAKRAAKKRKNPVLRITQEEVMAIAGKAMRDE